jgi:DNA primase catalytic subunit
MSRRGSADSGIVKRRLSLFGSYYDSEAFLQNLWLPPHMGRHHLRVEVRKLDGTRAFIRVRTSISNSVDVRNMATRLTPSGIFFTPVEWLDPVHLRLTRDTVRDIILTSPLYFDIDVRTGETIQAAKTAAVELIEAIRRLSNKEPDLLVFSGRNGFHVYYWNWDEIPSQFPNPVQRISEFIQSRRRVLHYLNSKRVKVDETVTADPWRVLRLPGSLHWKTGLTACQVHDLDRFHPKRDAAPFPSNIYTDVFGLDLDVL